MYLSINEYNISIYLVKNQVTYSIYFYLIIDQIIYISIFYKGTFINQVIYLFMDVSTVSVFKSDRNGFTKMRVTASDFFNTESQIHRDFVLKKSE